MSTPHAPQPERRYSYLGPRGTFTEAALAQVPEAVGQEWHSVNNVGEALADVAAGRSDAAMIAIENSIEGGVSVAQDALATIPGLRVVGEYLVPVSFVLVARRGTTLDQVRRINAHPVAYAQCHRWLDAAIPAHGHVPASSNVAAAAELFDSALADAAIAPPGVVGLYDVDVLAEGIADSDTAVTRFVLVAPTSRPVPPRTGADKTSIVAELSVDRAGALLGLLEQFSTRGVNMSLLESRPIGDALGRYRFVIDLDGHVTDERVADALLGVRRFSPGVTFLGSYPRADRVPTVVEERYTDAVFVEARDWLRELLSGAPVD
ncbi:prephenate dehydratase [Mycetocola reblochoni]|uniref:Prephenate dehydratase n=2 Tax=Mycetocola reblochoni TaxID=331618 RepID=A0A1R4IV80_9MICO|nr:prephenate dehydratase [Mycetocola reblochoni]RLP71018.1 prephenate dehydratase [Mycetocola reblochoni]SJN23579.1 Prephenate dehydratase [Mycetocola reblochoni REB411]